MMYLGQARFQVRELEGYAKSGIGSNVRLGLSVTVVDRAYCGQVLRLWRSEDYAVGSTAVWIKRAGMRSEAAAFAEELNARA